MNEPSSGFDPVDDLVDAFLERYRPGERPSLTEYTAQHPELAEWIRALFPALVAIARPAPLGRASGESSVRFHPLSTIDRTTLRDFLDASISFTSGART